MPFSRSRAAGDYTVCIGLDVQKKIPLCGRQPKRGTLAFHPFFDGQIDK
jgi:hypothetical protein